AGNTVVFKPASDTPHCATLLVELMAQAGFPAGTVNLVTGSGAEVGDAIVDNPDVQVISFTGHSATGKRIAERAGRRLKRVSLELGGKNGIVVLRDADLDLATDGIVWFAVAIGRPAPDSSTAISSSRRSSAASSQWTRSPRKRSSGRCFRSSPSRTTRLRSRRSTRRATA